MPTIPHRQARTIRYNMRNPPRIYFPYRKVWIGVAVALAGLLALGIFGLYVHIRHGRGF